MSVDKDPYQTLANSPWMAAPVNDVARTLKSEEHQRETTGTGSSSGPLQLRSFSLQEKIYSFLLRKEFTPSELFPLRAVPYGMENHFYHIR